MKIHFLQKLQQREEQNLMRVLEEPNGVDFCSNDYLSFTTDPILQKRIYEDLKGVPSGSTSSRLIRGQHSWIQTLEEKLADWSSRETALFFPSGYQANLAAMTAILGRETIVFSDESNHASIVDGIRLSGCEKEIFSHNNLEDLEKRLSNKASDKDKVVVIESLYSMRGDQAPLKQIAALCQKYQAQLVVDEAHATGVYGAGLVQRQNLQSQVMMTVHCAGKALGVSGAWIACDHILKEYLINFCRPFMYSTAPSPLVASALMSSLVYWEEVGPDRALTCLEKAIQLKTQLSVFLEPDILFGEGPILYINLRESSVALGWASYLQSCGFDVRAIRYPTVPQNEAGLRISLHANQSPDDLRQFVRALKQRVLEC